MQKLQSPLNTFAAIENQAIDSLDSILDVGLLTTLVRQPPGADITIAKLVEDRREGKKALEGSMRRLVDAGYVVKFKVQSVATAHWRTEFTVSTRVFTPEYVQELIDNMADVRSLRVEPEWLDPRS